MSDQIEVQGQVETDLTKLVTELLDVREVSLDDTFVAIGGDSITAALCTNRVSASYDVDIALDVFLNENLRLRDIVAAIVDARL